MFSHCQAFKTKRDKSSMTKIAVPMDRKHLSALVRAGEGRTLEFKRSTGELKEAMQTLCAFLNGSGGMVLFGVRPDGRPEGQQVSDQTIRDITQSGERFEPPADFTLQRLRVGPGREVLAMAVQTGPCTGPFTYDGRAYERVASTTRKMSQPKYEKRLLERAHGRRRWENEPADGLTLKDLDRKEILRTRELAIQQNRISPDTSRDIGEILDRLGLRMAGVFTQAAQVLYGKRFLPDYPQCLLKMGRFRGTEITGEIVDNRQEHSKLWASPHRNHGQTTIGEARFKAGQSVDCRGVSPHRRRGSLGPGHESGNCHVQEAWSRAPALRGDTRVRSRHVQSAVSCRRLGTDRTRGPNRRTNRRTSHRTSHRTSGRTSGRVL
jgi:hypothetical protein